LAAPPLRNRKSGALVDRKAGGRGAVKDGGQPPLRPLVDWEGRWVHAKQLFLQSIPQACATIGASAWGALLQYVSV
jgi:hypothetical protein